MAFDLYAVARRTAVVAAAAAATALIPRCVLSAPAPKAPWWDDLPGFYQTGNIAQAARVHATAVLGGAGDDPSWGLFGQRQRIAHGRQEIAGFHAHGMKALAWFEGFGSAGGCYVAQLKRAPNGAWVKDPADPTLTRVFHLHWDWQLYDGAGEIRWVGAHNYYGDEDFARPYTRTHPRYGAPPMRYPDGRVATGYSGSPADPRTSRVYDAGCSKDVLGRLTCEYEYNPTVNRIRKETGEPQGPTAGLLETGEAPSGVPDPGFTPEEWARLKHARYSGAFGAGKDSACPMWIDYARASVRQALDAGIDGLWVDNFSPWDSFNGKPIVKAFGEWSVAGFRGYLRRHFTPSELGRMGVADVRTFDVRAYLRDRCRALGGDPTNLDDPRWGSPRWRDDPVWRAYIIYKRQTGTAALSRYYRAIKSEASRAGKPDFLVQGNDTPIFSLGWPRGDLDMVSTELSWGWGLTTGPRGLMPPPLGSYVPICTLAREHARSRLVNAWMYVPDAQRGKPGIAGVLYYQGLANRALPMPQPDSITAGTTQADGSFFRFLRRVAPAMRGREPMAEAVGIYYSSSSQLMEMLPGGFRDHARQPHSFAVYGWGTALSQLHVPWRAVPEWKLSPASLAGLRLLIVPSAEVFPTEDVPTLAKWVRNGGRLLVPGACGARLGETGNFALAAGGSTLAPLTGTPTADGVAAQVGRGRVLCLQADPGLAFYLEERGRPAMLPSLRAHLAAAGLAPRDVAVDAAAVPWSVGVTPYRSPGRVFVDVNNTDIDLPTDTVRPTGPLRFTVALPPDLRGRRLRARVLSPGAAPAVSLRQAGPGRVEVRLGSVDLYTCVVLEAVTPVRAARR